MTATADVDAAFEAALASDAGLGDPGEVPAPPRHDRDPEAPHGRAEDGTPMAPHGLKPDGTPRLRPPGPGRGKTADKPRVTDKPQAEQPKSSAGKDGTDYTEDLLGLGTAVWIGASSLKGGRLFGIPVPDCRPYAAVWHAQVPQMAAVWNAAAQQNPTVRGYVQKLSGEGSWSWMVGVAVTSAGLVAGCIEIAKAPAEVKAQVAAANDANMEEFVKAQMAAAGLQGAA